MNRDLALKFQAYVDGELSARDAREVAETLERDGEARALVAELRTTKNLLAGNEPEVRVPETREFYWSKIAREIQRLEAQPVERHWADVVAGWRRFLAPLAGVAVIAFLAITALRLQTPGPVEDYLAEIENLSEHSTSYSFRSDNMFVVWVQEKDYQAADDQVEFIENEDL